MRLDGSQASNWEIQLIGQFTRGEPIQLADNLAPVRCRSTVSVL